MELIELIDNITFVLVLGGGAIVGVVTTGVELVGRTDVEDAIAEEDLLVGGEEELRGADEVDGGPVADGPVADGIDQVTVGAEEPAVDFELGDDSAGVDELGGADKLELSLEDTEADCGVELGIETQVWEDLELECDTEVSARED